MTAVEEAGKGTAAAALAGFPPPADALTATTEPGVPASGGAFPSLRGVAAVAAAAAPPLERRRVRAGAIGLGEVGEGRGGEGEEKRTWKEVEREE